MHSVTVHVRDPYPIVVLHLQLLAVRVPGPTDLHFLFLGLLHQCTLSPQSLGGALEAVHNPGVRSSGKSMKYP
ncbi:hypothetical protein TNIN_46691 [Trichonephila inaurata madagascariensis]|uniref:Uncharacterized protein n=1 Tax=Trichonephila inaurata madagascariensis TaxID=2747483 RepID=A0A8X7C3T0_9ARAC|nr:hypothetical protein TNIN_46691 [Trichonephila inaurata madagascariensis]